MTPNHRLEPPNDHRIPKLPAAGYCLLLVPAGPSAQACSAKRLAGEGATSGVSGMRRPVGSGAMRNRAIAGRVR